MQSSRLSDFAKFELACWCKALAPWEVFATFTFEWRDVSLNWTQKAFEKFMDRHLHDVSYFYAIERNPGSPGHHVHAMLADCMGLRRNKVWQRWKARYGVNRVEPIKSNQDVVNYCAKYVTKEGAWWNVKLRSPDLWRNAVRYGQSHLASPERGEAEAQGCIDLFAPLAVDTAGTGDAACQVATTPPLPDRGRIAQISAPLRPE